MTYAELAEVEAALGEAYQRIIPLREWLETLVACNEFNEKIIASMTRPESEGPSV